jgi:hypothetical protein
MPRGPRGATVVTALVLVFGRIGGKDVGSLTARDPECEQPDNRPPMTFWRFTVNLLLKVLPKLPDCRHLCRDFGTAFGAIPYAYTDSIEPKCLEPSVQRKSAKFPNHVSQPIRTKTARYFVNRLFNFRILHVCVARLAEHEAISVEHEARWSGVSAFRNWHGDAL